MEQVHKYYPSLSNKFNVDNLPFIKELFDDLYYRKLYESRNTMGNRVFYSMEIVTRTRISKEIFHTGIKFVLNPDSNFEEISVFPISFIWQWDILKYLRNFNLKSFDFSNQSIFELTMLILGWSKQQILKIAETSFVETTENTTFQQLVSDINSFYNITITIDETTDDYYDRLVNAIEAEDKNVYLTIFFIYLKNDSLDTTLENLQIFFYEYIDCDIKEYIKKIITPRITANLTDLTLALEFPRKWLKPIDENGKVIEGESSQLRFTAGSLSFDSETGLNFAQQSNLSFTKSQIANTGFTLSFDNAKIDFSRSENISEATAAGYPSDFVGVYVGEAEIGLPDGWAIGDNSTAKIVGRDMLIGTGGISGTIGLEAKEEGYDSPLLHCTFGNWELALDSFSVTFLQNSITRSDIRGHLTLPESLVGEGDDGVIDITINILGNGEFDITASKPEGLTLKFLNSFNFFTLTVKKLSIGRSDGEFYLGTGGTLSFEDSVIGKLLSGDIEVENLRIWGDGKTEIEGGGIALKEGTGIQVGPARIMVTSILHGSMERKMGGETVKYKYWGFDGGMNVNPGGVDARGTGIKYCYQCDGNGHDSFISIESIGIDITIPGNATPEQATAIIKGWLSVTQEKLPIEPGNENPAEAKVYGGGISLTLPKIHLDATIGMKYTPDVPAWIIEAGLSLPNPILVGATGLGIYGFSGILGRRYNTSKAAAGVSEDATWYDYYQAKQRGISLEKFSYPTQTQNSDKAFSAGVGMLLATANDGGRTFSSRVLLLLSLPNVFLIEGKARIMGKRVGFDDTNEPPFYAFIAISNESVEAGFGAHMKIPEDTGNLLKIDGDAELGYYFSNPKGWKINIGSDTKPITAEFVRLFRSEAYLMLSAKGIRTEVTTRLSFDQKYLNGALKAYVDAYMSAGGAISFEKPQMSGFGAVGGRCGVSIFKFGFDLGFDAGLCIEAVKPLLIEGSVGLSVGIKILRRRVSKSFTVDFRWENKTSLDTSAIPLLAPDSGVVARNMMSNELFRVCCVERSESLTYPLIPMDSYIDIKFLKPLNPKSSMSILGGVAEADGYTDCIPPNPNKRYVRHTYSLDGIKIECSDGGANWTEYHPYKAAAETVSNDFPKEIGHWQLAAAGIYDTIRLLAVSPFTYMDKGLKEWVRPERYGITGRTLYCIGTGTYWSKADFSGKITGRTKASGVLNSRTKSGQAVGYLVKGTAQIATVSDGYHDVAKCLEAKEGTALTLKFSSPARHVKLHASCAGAVTFTFGKTTYDDKGKGTTVWSAPVVRQGSDFLQPVEYESDDCIDRVKITVPKTAREELRKQIQTMKQRLYEGDYTTTREAMVAEIMTLVGQYETMQRIASGSVTTKVQDMQTELASQTATRTQAEQAKSAIDQLISEAQGLINECCLELPTNEPTAEDACIGRLEAIANSVSENQEVQEAINLYKQNLTTLRNNKEAAKTQYGENYANLRSSGQSYMQTLQAEQARLTATIVACHAKEEELVQAIAEIENATAAQQGAEPLGFGEDFRLYEIEWQTLADYEAEKHLPSRREIESAYTAKVDAVEHQIQPIWRPYTTYKVTVNVSDKIYSNGTQRSTTQSYYIGFRTGGPVGYFHEDYDVTVDATEKYVKEHAVAAEQGTQSDETAVTFDENSILQRYPLATLKDYIDYGRSYPNADGNLLNAKPLYYNDCELKLRYKYGFVQNMFRDWDEYDKKGSRNVLPSLGGRLVAVVKDPREEEDIPNPPEEHVETKYIPRAIVEWDDDETAKVPNGVKAEDVLRNPSLYNNEYALTNWECWEVGGKKIRPAHKETTVTVEGLRPNTLYTAIFYNEFTKPNNSMERREVHRYVFQTSRYGNLAEQIGSYRQTAANGEIAEAVQDFQRRVSETEMRDIRSIVSYRRLANKTNNLFDTYSDPFDCMMEGVLGLPPQEKPEQLEINRVRNEKGDVIGILLRSPEPLIDPKIPDQERSKFCSLIVQQLADSLTYNSNYLYSKDCSQLFITTDTFKLSGKSFHLEFKPIEWTGTEYKAMKDSVVTGEIKME